jgi:hypothetical protein
LEEVADIGKGKKGKEGKGGKEPMTCTSYKISVPLYAEWGLRLSFVSFVFLSPGHLIYKIIMIIFVKEKNR